jgi:hypothetical protein
LRVYDSSARIVREDRQPSENPMQTFRSGPNARFDTYLALRIGRFLSSEEELVRLSREIFIPPRRTLKAVSVHCFASAHCQAQGFTDSSVVPEGALFKRAGALLFRDGKGLVSDP